MCNTAQDVLSKRDKTDDSVKWPIWERERDKEYKRLGRIDPSLSAVSAADEDNAQGPLDLPKTAPGDAAPASGDAMDTSD